MELRPREFIYKIRESLSDRVDLKSLSSSPDFDSGYLTAFLGGAAASIVLILILSVTGLISFPTSADVASSSDIGAEEAGNKTVEMMNRRILQNTPNNVTAEFVDAESASKEGLPGFYRVSVRVVNPTNSQVTEVFTKKNGELVFLQFPRYFDTEKWESQRHY